MTASGGVYAGPALVDAALAGPRRGRAVLDGAWPGPWTTELLRPADAGQLAPPHPRRHDHAADALAAQLGRVRLIDARAGERFRGGRGPGRKPATSPAPATASSGTTSALTGASSRR